MKYKILVALSICLLWTAFLYADNTEFWNGRVVRVTDGDTLWITRDEGHARVRLYGIDAPESNQPFGKEATDFVYQLVFREDVEVETFYQDRYGRDIAMVYYFVQESFDQMPERFNLNEEIIKAGYAWVYEQYCDEPIRKQWQELEKEARTAGIGLWRDDTPIKPWEYRRGVRADGEIVKVSEDDKAESNDLAAFSIIFVIAAILLSVMRLIQKRRWVKKKRKWGSIPYKDKGTINNQEYYAKKLDALRNKRKQDK
jgi:endonuclease YncB( thermonuclease family)